MIVSRRIEALKPGDAAYLATLCCSHQLINFLNGAQINSRRVLS